MSAWAKPGAKCVCVDAENTNHFGIPELETKRVYTIREVGITKRGKVGVRLVEKIERNRHGNDEWLRLSRFRPVAPTTRTQEQDVALFRHMLTPVLEGAR